MRTLSSIAALGLVGALGCVDPPDLGSTAGMSFEELRAQLAQHREPGTGAYIVEWDLALHGDEALYRYWQSRQQGALAIYSVNNIDLKWSAADAVNLTYCVSDAFGARKPAVLAAMKAATEDSWAKFARVRFVHVPILDASCAASTQAVVFDVRPVDSQGQYLARAFFPKEIRAERNVLIDGEAYDVPNIPLSNILIHELGHALGFRHEHIRVPQPGRPGCVEDTSFRPLTNYDSASTMHYPQCGGTSTTLAFTTLDAQGVAAAYGAPQANLPPAVAILSPTNNATVLPDFVVEAFVSDPEVTKVEVLRGTQVLATVTAPPYRLPVSGLPDGQYSLDVRATDAAGQTASRSVLFFVKAPTPPPPPPPPPEPEPAPPPPDEGGCAAGGGAPGGLLAALGALLLGRRRRLRR
jgi:hypothetical protein